MPHDARYTWPVEELCLLDRNYATFNLKRTQLAIFNTLLSLYQAPLQLIGEYLNVLSERIEDLFRYCQRSGEVQLSVLVDDIFSRVIPVEITYGFLETKTFCIVSVQYWDAIGFSSLSFFFFIHMCLLPANVRDSPLC